MSAFVELDLIEKVEALETAVCDLEARAKAQDKRLADLENTTRVHLEMMRAINKAIGEEAKADKRLAGKGKGD